MLGMNKSKTRTKFDAGHLLILIMVSIYPLLVIPGPYSYFYWPRYLMLTVVSVVALIYLYYRRVKLNNYTLFFMLLILVFAAIATIYAKDPLTALGGSQIRYTGLSTYICCAILWILASNNEMPQSVLRTMVYSSAIVSLIAIMQFTGINVVPHEYFRSGYHSYSTLGNPNFLGTYTVFMIPAAIMLYFHEGKKHWLIITALIYAALLSSMTRGSWLAFLIMIVIMFPYIWKHYHLRNKLYYLASILIVVTVVFLFSNSQVILKRTTTITAEIISAVELDDDAGSNRMFIWKAAIRMIPDNWAFGVGPDNVMIPTTPGYSEDKVFNHFLDIAISVGVLALMVYIVFLVFCFKYRRKDWIGTTLCFMIISYLLQGQVNIDVIMNLPLFWITLGLTQSQIAVNSDHLMLQNESPLFDLEKSIIYNKYILRRKIILIFIVTVAFIVFSLTFNHTYNRYGVIEFEGEGTYKGQLRGSTFHGQGIWESANGSRYTGNFKYGSFDGYGKLEYLNGANYEGEFKEGFFHGFGKITTADGIVIQGVWSMGVMVEKVNNIQ